MSTGYPPPDTPMRAKPVKITFRKVSGWWCDICKNVAHNKEDECLCFDKPSYAKTMPEVHANSDKIRSKWKKLFVMEEV